MSEVVEMSTADEEELSFWGKHRFLLLIVLTIAMAIVMTCISIIMYNVSGTAQLDLSRPGYQSVSDQVDTDNTIDDYSAFGPVNKTTVDEFTKIYDEQANKAKAVDAFSGDPLNPEVLILGTSSATE
jgi:hypothetical protein